MTTTGKPQELLSATRIAERLQVLGEEINQHYQGKEILLISILDGAIVFTADLLRQLLVPTHWIASCSSWKLHFSDLSAWGSLKSDLSGMHVLLVDDILDTGKTMQFACEQILAPSQSRSKPAFSLTS